MKTILRFELDHITLKHPLREVTNINVIAHLLRALACQGDITLTAEALERGMLDKRELVIIEAPNNGAILRME